MSAIGLWWRAARPFSFTVSVLPPILGSLVAALENPGLDFGWLRFVLCLLGCFIAHAGSNLIADYYDFKNRVDRDGTYGSSGVLTGKLMTPAAVFRGSIVCFLVAALIGAYFVMTTPNGTFLIWLVLLGGFFAFFYTAKPFELKYHALGDIGVFLCFGSAMTLGAYYVQAARFSWGPVLYVLPAALLVDAVLHSNNLRDIAADRVAGIRTVPIVIGERRAAGMYAVLVLGAYALHVVLVLFARLPAVTLITMLSLPLAVGRVKTVMDRASIPPEKFADIDARTAQLHSAYGLLLIAALLVQQFVIGK